MPDPNETTTQSNNTQGNGTSTPEPDWYSKPPAWLTELQQTVTPPTNAQPQNPPAASNQGAPESLIAELQSMPEKIVNALREAKPNPPATPNDDKTGDNGGSNTASGDSGTPGKAKSFAEMWFGS